MKVKSIKSIYLSEKELKDDGKEIGEMARDQGE